MKAYLKLLLRHRWFLAFAPVIGGFLALGYISSYYNNLYAGDFEAIRAYIVPNFHLIVSLLSVWWTVIFFSQFTTEQGNELIYMSFRTSSVIKCQLLMEALYAILVFLYFLAVRNLYHLPFALCYFLAAESFFMGGLAFFLIQLTKNISLSLVGVAVYCVFLLKFDSGHILSKFSIFPEGEALLPFPVRRLAVEVGIAAVFYILGGVCFRKRKVYF